MKKILIVLSAVGLFLMGTIGAEATSFTFMGSDTGGTGSATWDINIYGNELRATLDNTSPITLDFPNTGANAPGITGFGFNIMNSNLSLAAWELQAFSNTGATAIIGSSQSSPSNLDKWILNSSNFAGITADYLFTTAGSNIDGALYNPAAAGSSVLPGGSNSVFFTSASLVMFFDKAPLVDNSSPFVRMQNVGAGGAGSLKLTTANPVPEPATMLLLGVGLVGVGAYSRRKLKK